LIGFLLVLFLFGCQDSEAELKEKILSINNEYIKTGIVSSDNSLDTNIQALVDMNSKYNVQLNKSEFQTLHDLESRFIQKHGNVQVSKKEGEVLGKLKKATDLLVDYVLSNKNSFSRQRDRFRWTANMPMEVVSKLPEVWWFNLQ